MTNVIMVPKSAAEAPTGGGDKPFPAGNWLGTIDPGGTRVRGLPAYLEDIDLATLNKRGYTSNDVETVSIQIGQNSPLDGQDDVGERKFFVDFVTRDGQYDYSNVDATEQNHPAWQLQRSMRLFVNLAMALGLTEEIENEGQTYETVAEDAIDTLRSGGLEGNQVGFIVRHRTWKSGDKSGVEEICDGFFTAV